MTASSSREAARNELKNGLAQEGFTPDQEEYTSDRFFQERFIREAEASIPRLELHITHVILGRMVSINSDPYEQRAHYHTKQPILHEEVLTHVSGYITALREGREYRGPMREES